MTDINSAASLTKMGLLFLEGLLSFLSPCVIPILPIYIGILAGKKEENANGELVFNKKIFCTRYLCYILYFSICNKFYQCLLKRKHKDITDYKWCTYRIYGASSIRSFQNWFLKTRVLCKK